MTKELVQFVAQAICAARTVNCQKQGCCVFYEDHAQIAVDAVLEAQANEMFLSWEQETESYSSPNCGCPDYYYKCPIHNPSSAWVTKKV